MVHDTNTRIISRIKKAPRNIFLKSSKGEGTGNSDYNTVLQRLITSPAFLNNAYIPIFENSVSPEIFSCICTPFLNLLISWSLSHISFGKYPQNSSHSICIESAKVVSTGLYCTLFSLYVTSFSPVSKNSDFLITSFLYTYSFLMFYFKGLNSI